jgi:hypothetical protein
MSSLLGGRFNMGALVRGRFEYARIISRAFNKRALLRWRF